jgi:hypothetical protein
MKNTTLVGVLIGCTLFAGASVALAQTYVYPVTPVNSTYYPPAPIASSCASFTVYQQFGSSDSVTGGQVTALQQLLNREGYLSGVTGYFDQGTGIFSTGTVGPQTRAILSQESCANGYNGYVNPVVPVSPVYTPPAYIPQGNNNCSWINGMYQCNVPSYPVNCPYFSNNGYYGNNNGYGCGNNVTITSFNVNTANTTNSYSGNVTSITVQGSGFSPNGNTVRFDSVSIPNVSAFNGGTTLVFTVPSGYYSGSFPITVTNSQGITSNSLSYTMTSNNCYGYNPYNNCSNNYPNSSQLTLSMVSGSGTSIPVGASANLVVTANDQNNQRVTITTNWGDGSNNDVQWQYISGLYTLSLLHSFTTPGTYTVRVTATDSNGFTAYSSQVVTVVGNGYYYGRSY